MKIRDLKKIVTNTFPTKYKDLVDPLAFIFNPFIESVTNALTSQLTFNDNFNANDIDFEIKLPANNILLRHSVRGRIQGIIVTRVLNLEDNAAVLTVAPFVEFAQVDETTIQIRNIIGLTPGVKYKLRLLLLGS